MAAGDLTGFTPILCQGSAAVKTAIDSLNLAAQADMIHLRVTPIWTRANTWLVSGGERSA